MGFRNTTALRCYRLLLNAYPADFRAQYRDQMLCVFEDSWRAATTLARPAVALRFWVNTLEDVVKSALLEWISQLTAAFRLERGISFAASVFIHVIVLWALTWLAFHPLPPPGDACQPKTMSPEIKIAAFPASPTPATKQGWYSVDNRRLHSKPPASRF